MSLKHGWVTGLLVALLAVAAHGQQPSEKELREEAHRTVLRRLSQSEGAKTKSLELSKGAGDLIDLYLDLARNEADVMAGRAPASRQFHGPAHGIMKVEKGELVYAGCFVNLVIDRVEVSLKDVPPIIETALDKKVFRRSAIARDGTALDGWRLNMVATLTAAIHPSMGADKEWSALRDRAADAILAELPGSGTFDTFTALNCLQIVGDDRLAKALIGKADALAKGGKRIKAMWMYRAVCNMDTPTARAYAKKVLRGDDPELAAIALGALGRDPDEATFEFMEKVVAPGSPASAALRRAAISGFVLQGTARARSVLERLFDGAASESDRYSMACAVTRAGSGKAVSYLRKKLEEFARSGRVQDVVKANVVRALLKEHDEREQKDGDE